MYDKLRQRPGRPLRGKEKRNRASFTLDPRQLAWLKETARTEKLSRSEFLDFVIREAQTQYRQLPSLFQTRVLLPLHQIQAFCGRHHVKKLALFGSVLRENFGDESDIDILIEFQPGQSPDLFTLVGLEKELSGIFGGRKVDLRTPQELSRYFRKKVLDEAQVIYEARSAR